MKNNRILLFSGLWYQHVILRVWATLGTDLPNVWKTPGFLHFLDLQQVIWQNCSWILLMFISPSFPAGIKVKCFRVPDSPICQCCSKLTEKCLVLKSKNLERTLVFAFWPLWLEICSKISLETWFMFFKVFSPMMWWFEYSKY